MEHDAYGKAIRALRIRLKLTQEQFMDKTGMARSQMYYLESGKRLPRLDTLEYICAALQVSLPEFFHIVEQFRDPKYR